MLYKREVHHYPWRLPLEIGRTLLNRIEVDKLTFKDGTDSDFDTYEHKLHCYLPNEVISQLICTQ